MALAVGPWGCGTQTITPSDHWSSSKLVSVLMFEQPPPRLTSRRPIWSDMTPVDTTAQWREDWPSATVVNYTTVTGPTNRQPGFNLPRQPWFLLNRFQTDQGPCHAFLHKWDLAKSPTCDCGQQQTMSHIVDACPLTKLDGDVQLLHEAEDDAVKWLESSATMAFAKWMKMPYFRNSIHNRNILSSTVCLCVFKIIILI